MKLPAQKSSNNEKRCNTEWVECLALEIGNDGNNKTSKFSLWKKKKTIALYVHSHPGSHVTVHMICQAADMTRTTLVDQCNLNKGSCWCSNCP
jgi:hypothetical protein